MGPFLFMGPYNMNPHVSLIKCPDYGRNRVYFSVRRAVELLGGAEKFIRPGARVLIKPNMLAAKPPDKAVTTHPEVVRAAVRLVRAAGGVPVIGDSQAFGAFKTVAEVSGIAAVAAEEGAELIELSEAVRAPGMGTFKHFEVAREVMRADAVINLPKLKTHAQMLLTLAVKNLFGCIPGRRKAQWHFKSGVDKGAFATMLVELHGIVRPTLNIVDAVVGMEGNGPGSGTPREIGLIAAGTDAFALDMALSEILGVSAGRLPTTKAAMRLGLAPDNISGVDISGDFVGVYQARVEDFKLPTGSSLEWKIPEPIRRLLKEALTTRPRIDKTKCQSCLMCHSACPAGVIKEGEGGLTINYRECIRCFCCQEACPVGAIEVVEGWLLKYLG
jgi:uncharacterized protein (DUF362 family)/NAD-dependent dihydropyrimidine dehydrogenase PreA subunit